MNLFKKEINKSIDPILSMRRLSSNDIEELATLFKQNGKSRLSENIDGLKMIASLMPIWLIRLKSSHDEFRITRIQAKEELQAKRLYIKKEYDCIINHLPLDDSIEGWMKKS